MTIVKRMLRSIFCLTILSAIPALAQQTEVKFITQSGTWETNMQKVIDAFEAENPDINVVLETYPFRQLFEVIEIRMQSQSTDFDLLSVDVPLVTNYTLRGLLHPLDEYFSEEEIEDIWVPASWQAGMADGNLMAAPQNNSTQFMYINLRLFEEAGVTPPPSLSGDTTPENLEAQLQEVIDGRWTWEQVVQASQELTQDTTGDGQSDVWGVIFDQISRPYQMLALPESLEQPSLDPEGLQTEGYLNSPKWIEAGQFYYDLFNTLEVSPRGVGPDEAAELFGAGNVAMLVGGEWNLIPLSESSDVDLAVAAHPYFESGVPATPTGSWHVGISPYSQNKDAAAKFLKFLTASPEGTRIWYEAHGQFPATLELLSEIDSAEATTVFPRSSYRLGAYEARNTAAPRPATPGYLEFEDILAQALEDIRNGTAPEQSLNAAVPRIDRALQRYPRP